MYVPNIRLDSGRINRGLGADRMRAREQRDNILTPIINNNNTNQNVPTPFGNPFGYKIIDEVDDGFGNNKKIKTREKEKLVVRFCELNDIIIKTTTGFSSLAAMMGFIVIACNGEYETMKSTCTQLTWLEEWLVYFECLWGKSSQRWVDLQFKYKASPRRLRKIFDRKTAIVIECATIRWPRFVTFDEDIEYRKQKWSDYYYGKRIIMWDNTNVNITFKPSLFDIQRCTYSQYYAGNVAKGGVFLQPCGWFGTHELWVGSISDSEYMQRSNVLQIQQTYIETHDPTPNEPFTVILDKGYRITAAAWGVGNTFILQPSFAKSDKKFTGLETVRNAGIASDRSANERAVRLSKMCGYIRMGLLQNESTKRLDNAWITWSFQSNFNYKPVL
jgi:DDE superfamily endonuclease